MKAAKAPAAIQPPTEPISICRNLLLYLLDIPRFPNVYSTPGKNTFSEGFHEIDVGGPASATLWRSTRCTTTEFAATGDTRTNCRSLYRTVSID